MLSEQAKFLLDVVADSVVSGRQPILDLTGLNPFFSTDPDDVRDYLIQKVVEHSDRKRTVRPADRFLFRDQVHGAVMHFVVCLIGTPPGEVSELTDDMVLFTIQPNTIGLMLPEIPASSELVAHRRAEFEQAKGDLVITGKDFGAADKFLADLTEAVRRHIHLVVDNEKVRVSLYELLDIVPRPDLAVLCAVCRVMEVDLMWVANRTRTDTNT